MTRRAAKKRPHVECRGIREEKDRVEAVETLVRAFGGGRTEAHVTESLWKMPFGDPDHTRVAIAQNRVVSVVHLGPRTIRFGPVTVSAMTIGPVGTHNRYMRRGYAAAVMQDASRYMKEQGVLIAYLQGIPDFYYRFGYYPYLAQGTVTVPRAAAGRESTPGRLRRMTRQDVAAVKKIYDTATDSRLCAAVRERPLWEWVIAHARHNTMFRKPRVILDHRGRLCGHVLSNRHDDTNIVEIVVRQDEASCRVALGALARMARRVESKEIKLRLPWDDALAVFLRHCVGATFSLRPHPTGGALMKIVDFPTLMRRLCPLFTLRWKAARAFPSTCRFTLESELGAVGMILGRRTVQVAEAVRGPCVRIPQRWLSGLLTGYFGIPEIAARKGTRIPLRLLSVLETLFPAGWPFVYIADDY